MGDVVSVVTGLVQLLLYITGLVAGILVRGRDGRAGLLIALGFGVQILGAALGFVEGLVLPSLISSLHDVDAVQAFTFLLGVVLRLLNLAAFGLVFWGLFRLVRNRPAANAGVAR